MELLIIIQKKLMMKHMNKLYLMITVIFCYCTLNSCTEFDYPPVDQLQITNKQFLAVCDTMINITSRINKKKQFDDNDFINSFVIQVGNANCNTSFQFIYDNNSSIGEAVYDESKIYGCFYYKNYTFLVQNYVQKTIPNIFRKTGYQKKITFVRHFHKSFLTNLFENKREIVIVPNYDPKYYSFCYINGKFIMYGK